MTKRGGLVIERRGGFEQRRRDPERAGEFGDRRTVLLHHVHCRGRRRVDSDAIIGPRNSKIRDVPALLDMIFDDTLLGSSPALAPSTIASAAAALCTATSRLATNFMRVPLPNAPR